MLKIIKTPVLILMFCIIQSSFYTLVKAQNATLKLYTPVEESVTNQRILARMPKDILLSNGEILTLKVEEILPILQTGKVSFSASDSFTGISIASLNLEIQSKIRQSYEQQRDILRSEIQLSHRMVNAPQYQNGDTADSYFDLISDFNDLDTLFFGSEAVTMKPKFGQEGAVTEVTTNLNDSLNFRKSNESNDGNKASSGDASGDSDSSIRGLLQSIRDKLSQISGGTMSVTKTFFQPPVANIAHIMSRKTNFNTSGHNAGLSGNLERSDENDYFAINQSIRETAELENIPAFAQNIAQSTTLFGANESLDLALSFRAKDQIKQDRALQMSILEANLHRDGFRITTILSVLSNQVDAWHQELSTMESLFKALSNKPVKP